MRCFSHSGWQALVGRIWDCLGHRKKVETLLFMKALTGAGGWGWWFRFVIRDSFRFLQVLQFFNRQKLLNVMLKVFKTGKFRQINCGKAQVCFAARPSQPPSAATHPLNVSIILPPMSRDSKDVMGSWHFSVISIQMILLIGWSPCPHWPGNWPIKIQIPESCWRKFSSLFFNRF